MAAHSSGANVRQRDTASPVVPIVAGAAAGVVMFGIVVGLWMLVGHAATPPEPFVAVPGSTVPAPPVPPGPGTPAAPVGPAWWDALPDAKLAATVGLLNHLMPAEQPLVAALGDKSDAVRYEAYQKLTAQLPDLVRRPDLKHLLGRLLVECYAREPADKNVAPLAAWLVQQVPAENVAFPPGYQGDDLDRAFWAVDLALDVVTDKAIRLDRSKQLAQEVGKALGITIAPGASRADLKSRTEKLLAQRCYRNLVPTAAVAVDAACMLRETLLQSAAPYLAPAFRDGIDVELAYSGLASAKAAWPAYSTLLRSCLSSTNPQIELQLVALYEQADPELAARMEPLLASKWKVAADSTLQHPAKVRAIKKALGVPEPVDRLVQLDKLARDTLANAKSPPAKPQAVLQETVRLTHAATLACALLQNDAGLGRFDALVARVPEIDQTIQAVKGGNPKQPGDKRPADKPALVKGGPRVYQDQLRLTLLSKNYAIVLKRGKTYSIDLVSNAFDAYLYLRDSKGNPLAEDDDSGGNLNARIVFTAPFDDNYRVVASSLGGRGIGPYVLSIQEIQGFAGPGFGMIGFPGKGFPFPRPPFGFRPPGLFPGFPPPAMPFGPVGPAVPPGPDLAQPADPGDATPQIDPADLAGLLEKNPVKTRINAFENIAGRLKGVLAQSDVPPRTAQAIAKYLLTIRAETELGAVLAKLAPVAKSRSLLLALADRVDQPDAEAKASESVVGSLAGQPMLLAKDDNWRLICRKQLLLQALDLSSTQSKAAAEAADILRDLYKEQCTLLDVGAPDLKQVTQPAHVLEKMIEAMAASLGRHDPSQPEKQILELVPRRLAAVAYVADNDLERTAMLQPIWIELLSMHLARRCPAHADALRAAGRAPNSGPRPASSVLEQLRSGEEALLRMWLLAVGPK